LINKEVTYEDILFGMAEVQQSHYDENKRAHTEMIDKLEGLKLLF